MDKEIKKKWVEALRSGKYRQGHYVLRDENDSFCCLGVLVDITYPSMWSKEAIFNNPRKPGISCYAAINSTFFLPSELAIKFNISKDMGDELTSMNDEGYSFDDIANYIESQ